MLLNEMAYKILVLEPFITIQYRFDFGGLYVDWTGDQSKESVIQGCELMLECLKSEKCRKILNDNSNVTSIWSDASEWVARDWFPRMSEAGMDYFAWVYSPNVYSKLSTDKTLAYTPKSLIIPFYSVASAEEWLKAV
jgi:hypothetical protein